MLNIIEHSRTTVYVWTGDMHAELVRVNGGAWEATIEDSPMDDYQKQGLIVEHQIDFMKSYSRYNAFYTKVSDMASVELLAMLDCGCLDVDSVLHAMEFDMDRILNMMSDTKIGDIRLGDLAN